MRVKAAFLIGGAVGYVLGTRAGREQFETIRGQARKVWEDPRVQGTVSDVEQRATDFVKDKTPDLKELVNGAVRSASDAVRGRSGEAGTGASGASWGAYGSEPTTTPPQNGTHSI